MLDYRPLLDRATRLVQLLSSPPWAVTNPRRPETSERQHSVPIETECVIVALARCLLLVHAGIAAEGIDRKLARQGAAHRIAVAFAAGRPADRQVSPGRQLFDQRVVLEPVPRATVLAMTVEQRSARDLRIGWSQSGATRCPPRLLMKRLNAPRASARGRASRPR